MSRIDVITRPGAFPLHRPKVSVLMSVYNAEGYLRESVGSILDQTFSDFEFIIVNDGSKDATGKILEEFGRNDSRIRLLSNPRNLGLTASLNRGVQTTQGDYLARQDGDDVSMPGRLGLQVGYLDKNPDVDVVGTWVEYIDKGGKRTGMWQTPAKPWLVKWSLLFGNCMAHPSVMFRRGAIANGAAYRPEIVYAQDYELWTRLSNKGNLANVPEVLYSRRVHDEMIGVKHLDAQERTVKQVMQKAISRLLGREIPKAMVFKLRQASREQPLDNALDLKRIAALVAELHVKFMAVNDLDKTGRSDVRKDTARRLANLALHHGDKLPVAAGRVLWKSIRLDPRLALKTWLNVADRFLWMPLTRKV